jgi:hypothetical protein
MSSESSHGLVHLGSPYTVSETIARLEGIVSSKGLTVLARIDHSDDAARVGLEMNPTELLLFGSSKAGTPLMVASPTAAIDLPLKHSPGAMRGGTYGSPTTARNTWQSGIPFHLICYGTSPESELCVKRL